MKHEIYKDHYQFEWDQRSHLTSALNIPIAVSTILGGAVTVMAKTYPYEQTETTYVFVIALLLAVICISFSIFYLFQALHGYTYERIPTPLKLKSYYDELLVWNLQNGSGKTITNERFEKDVDQRIAEAVEINAKNNKNKFAYLYRCNTILAIAVIFIAISSVPYLISTINEKDKIYSVGVISLPVTQSQLKMEKVVMPEPEDQPTSNETPPEPLSEPVMPPNESIKEHVVEPVTKKTITERQE